MSILHISLRGSKDMKIESINTYVVDAGWRPWQFTEIKTDHTVMYPGTRYECVST